MAQAFKAAKSSIVELFYRIDVSVKLIEIPISHGWCSTTRKPNESMLSETEFVYIQATYEERMTLGFRPPGKEWFLSIADTKKGHEATQQATEIA